MSRQANFSTHQGACSCNRLVQQICPWSLLPHINQFDMREQNSGAKFLLRNIFFSLEIIGADEGALLRERVAGACCGSKLPRLNRPLVYTKTNYTADHKS